MAFLTGGLGNVHYYVPLDGDKYVDNINATNFISASQKYVSTSVVLSIVLIVLSALLFFTGCNTRRNYYITNYVIIGVIAIFAVAVTIYSFVGISTSMNLFYNDIAWEAGTNGGLNYADKFNSNYVISKSSANFVIGYILYALVLVDVAALVLNLIWKIKLMKGEKALLQDGFVKEVA
ncbi:MAG: hypothetical protein K2J54_01965 [Clostridia bacterium]|nr:hypothetical protein [Clostridia bacterium]